MSHSAFLFVCVHVYKPQYALATHCWLQKKPLHCCANVVFVFIFIATTKTGKMLKLSSSSSPIVCSVLPLGPPALPVWQGEPPH